MTTLKVAYAKPRLCACGCNRPLKRGVKAWATPQCVPKTLRAAGGRKGGRTQAMRRHLRMFHEEVKRLEACKPMTREDVLVAFASVYRKGYHACAVKQRLAKKRAA